MALLTWAFGRVFTYVSMATRVTIEVS